MDFLVAEYKVLSVFTLIFADCFICCRQMGSHFFCYWSYDFNSIRFPWHADCHTIQFQDRARVLAPNGWLLQGLPCGHLGWKCHGFVPGFIGPARVVCPHYCFEASSERW